MGGTSATITSISYSGDSYVAYPTASPSFPDDDKEIAISHRNHGMHQRTNNVEIEGVISEGSIYNVDYNSVSRCYFYSVI